MSKEEVIQQFDPNGPGAPGKLFGLPFTYDTASLVVMPIPWEVTVSYRSGTAQGPAAIVKASQQVDLAVRDIPDAWKLGIHALDIPDSFYAENQKLRAMAAKWIRQLESGVPQLTEDPVLQAINQGCENLNIFVKATAQRMLKEGKLVGLVGGDHSTPLGLLRALSEKYDRFGILQIDAHADLRKAYEGFTYSHASIMYNALKLPAVNKIVQVGVRDYADEELAMMSRGMGRIKTFFHDDVASAMASGATWKQYCDSIIKDLPSDVYVSFDIDGLQPAYCPNTGTPVPGGLNYDEAIYLLKAIVQSGKRIIGFDLCEVAPGPNEWDANVGARVLYHLCNQMALSQGKLKAARPS